MTRLTVTIVCHLLFHVGISQDYPILEYYETMKPGQSFELSVSEFPIEQAKLLEAVSHHLILGVLNTREKGKHYILYHSFDSVYYDQSKESVIFELKKTIGSGKFDVDFYAPTPKDFPNDNRIQLLDPLFKVVCRVES